VVGYDVDLLPVGDDLELAVDLPEGAPNSVVDLGVLPPPGAAIAVRAGEDDKARDLTPTDRGGRKTYRLQNPAERVVTVRLKKPGAIALSGEDARTGPYFAATFRPDLALDAKQKALEGTSDAVLLVDTSLSSNPDRFNVWLKLMKSILDENRANLKRFAVLFFNVEALWYRPAFIENTPENVAALMEFAQKLSLEGATDLEGALRQAARPPWAGGMGAAPGLPGAPPSSTGAPA
jgi:hypothetical protein